VLPSENHYQYKNFPVVRSNKAYTGNRDIDFRHHTMLDVNKRCYAKMFSDVHSHS